MIFTQRYEREYWEELVCPYDLQDYPFDIQECTIDVEIPEYIEDYIKLAPYIGKNLGPSKLVSSEITQTKINVTNNSALVQLKITLKHVPSHSLATIYFPITLVLIVAMITLFIDQSHFEATIMVNLTAMLVLYTLYQSISENVPKTAYLKLLDYWVIYAMLIIFIVFVIEVLWELMDQNQTEVVEAWTSQQFRKSDNSKLRWAKYVLPVITLIFFVVYIAIVIYIYYFKSLD